MTYTIHNASTWSLDKLAPYMSGVLREMGRLSKRMPKDLTTEALFVEFCKGHRTLWLVLDDDELVAIALTSLRTIDATKVNFAALNDLAGRDVAKYAPELCSALEQWAQENKAEPEIIGRRGWEKLLARHGYTPHAVIYRKSANGI